MFLPPEGALIAGKYRIESLLGEGGMGAVFRARHEIMDKRVAVKWLKPTCGDEIAAKHRFVQEARAAARIRHPNVVDVYDVGEQAGCLFMVMELLEGMTFGDYLERRELSVAEAMRHLISAMRGVAAAHAVGITHRDIKPENIFIAFDSLHTDGVAKILDFGISKLHDDPHAPHLTTPGTAMGTPHYMSFEQIRGSSDVDHRTDIYAFGVLLYQALTGALPYDGETLPAIVLQASMGRAVRAIELRPDLPVELDEVVMRAIALKKEDRFPSMDAMISALTRVQLGRKAGSARTHPSVVTAAPTPRPPQPRKPAFRQSIASRATQPSTPLSSQPPPAERTPNPWFALLGVALGIAAGSGMYTLLVGDSSSSPAPAGVTAGANAPTSVVTAAPPKLAPLAPPSRRGEPGVITAPAHDTPAPAASTPPARPSATGSATTSVTPPPARPALVATPARPSAAAPPAQAAAIELGSPPSDARPAQSKAVAPKPLLAAHGERGEDLPEVAPVQVAAQQVLAQQVLAEQVPAEPTQALPPTQLPSEPSSALHSHRSGTLRREDL